MSDALDVLIAKLEQATEGSRELDCLIYALHWPSRAIVVQLIDGDDNSFNSRWCVMRQTTIDARVVYDPPLYTTSLDAALTLRPDGAEYSISTLYGTATVELPLNGGAQASEVWQRKDGNVILAFVQCCLRARKEGR